MNDKDHKAESYLSAICESTIKSGNIPTYGDLYATKPKWLLKDHNRSSNSEPSFTNFPLSTRKKESRYKAILKKLNEDEILKKIPTRMAPDVEFSEDEEEAPAKSPNSASDDSCLGSCRRKITFSNSLGESSGLSEKENLEAESKVGTDCSKKSTQSFSASCAFSSFGNEEEVILVKGKNYTILSCLGKGASCKVYAAYDRAEQKVVAIKRVDLENADELVVDGFKQEIEYLKKLEKSEYVIKMYDYEFNEKELVLILEKGDTDLAQYLADEKLKKNLTPIMIKFYWLQMLNAVGDIQKHGIIHSDLKPANFLLVAGHLKLIDFGISAVVPLDETSVFRDTQVGTVNYMSPEAVSSYFDPKAFLYEKCFKVSVKSDVWSLGCILYYMVYGHSPFQHFRLTMQKVQAIVNPEYEIPFSPLRDAALCDVLKLCLTRDVKKRASVEQLLCHPYLTNEATELFLSKVDNSIIDMVTQYQALTPCRQSHVSEVIQKLAKQKKNAL